MCEDMDKESLEREQAEMEEEEAEKATPLERKSRNGDDGEIVAVYAVDGGEASNGVFESNGRAIWLEISQNGAGNEEMTTPAAEEERIEGSDGVLENEAEVINGEQETEEESSDGVLENEAEVINGEQEAEEESSDGVLENELECINGEQEIEKSKGVLENELEFINGEQEIEKSNRVLENELEFINGEQETDKSNGVLKNGSEFTDGVEKIDDCHSFLEIEPEATNRELKLENLVFHDKDEAVKSIATYILEEQALKGPGPGKVEVSEINDAYVEEIEENGVPSSNLEHYDSSSEGGTSHSEPSNEIESAESDLINEDDLEITEFDVERVIQKQTTHDLYCPNCKSCITKRVILRKRKRGVRIPDEDVKRNRTGTAVGPELGTVSSLSPEGQVHQEDEVGLNDAQEPTIDEDGRDRQPDIFRCLSCFSFFIPTGDGFKLFKRNWFTKIFAPNKHETAVGQGSSSRTTLQHVYTAIPSSDSAQQSGLPSVLKDTGSTAHFSEGLNITYEARDTSLRLPNLIPSVNGKVRVGVEGQLDMKATEAGGLEATTGLNASQENGNKTLVFPNLRPFLKWKPATGVGSKLDMEAAEAVDATIQQFSVSTSEPVEQVHINRDTDLHVATLHMKTEVTNVESAEDGISFTQKDGLKLLITSDKGLPILEKIEEINKPNGTVQTGDKETIQLSPPSASVIHASDVDGKLNISVSIPHDEQDVTATIVTKSVLENKNVDFRGNDGGELHAPEVPQQIITETKIEVHPNEPIKTEFSSALLDAPVARGNDTVITIDRQLPAVLPAAAATASQLGTPVSPADGGDGKIEVVKSMVYGGLAECITSMSVVSSAAGGGAATLNVLALAAANLIGGLFVISHNLWDLRCDRYEQVSNQVTEQRDRYRELLGRRQNFVLHAVVAIISYLMFGLVTPVVYGFSFRESDDKQLKLVVAAAASLLCILLLAVAKAYVQRPPKPYLKTVFTFLIMGFMVSGASYAAGDLVGRLLEKLGLFQAASPSPNLLLQEKMPVGSGWASY